MRKPILKNQRGQGLIEYVILVAIIGVGSIVLVRSVGESVNVKFAQIVASMGGKIEGGSPRPVIVSSSALKKKDLRNFMKGATGKADSKSDSDNGDETP